MTFTYPSHTTKGCVPLSSDVNEVADNRFQRSELDYLIYNDPLAYADLVLNGNPEAYLKAVTEYKPLDS